MQTWILVAFIFVLTSPIVADEIAFKTGQTLDNVMIVSIDQANVTVKFQNGQLAVYQKAQIRALKQKPVYWPDPKAEEKIAKKEEVKSDQKKPDKEKPSSAQAAATASIPGAMLRSLVFPGWGQFAQGRNFAGVLYAAGAVTIISVMSYQYTAYVRSKHDYSNSSRLIGLSIFAPTGAQGAAFYYGFAQQRNARAVAERRALSFNLAAAAFGGLVAWNVADIFLFRPKDKVAVGTDGQSVLIAYRARF